MVTAYQIEKFFGLQQGYVSKYVKRGKVIRDSRKKIDTEDPVNIAFLQKLAARHRPTDLNNKHARDIFALDLEYKRLGIIKTELEVRLLKNKNAKASGELIPADLVRDIFRRNGKLITTAFSQSLEAELVKVADRFKLKAATVSKMRKEIITVTNRAIDNGVHKSAVIATELTQKFY